MLPSTTSTSSSSLCLCLWLSMSMSLTLISHVRPALAHITGLRHVAPSVRTHLPYSLPYINTQLSQSHNNNNNNVIKTSAITIKMEQESIDSVELRSRFIQTLLSRRTARGLNENPEFFDFDSCTNYIYFVHIFFLVFVSVPLSVEVAKPVANPLFQDNPPRSSEVQIFLSVFYLCFLILTILNWVFSVFDYYIVGCY